MEWGWGGGGGGGGMEQGVNWMRTTIIVHRKEVL